ncbi:hypothetical protein SWPG_00106 [Synechococcus phage S-CBM2]|nr:hypothetical protein SWPG_00106 [Synechococcus phage S-CBM2]
MLEGCRMNTSIAAWLLTACLEGNIVCVRDQVPKMKYYEPGKACYIEGIFYESCPKRN